MAMEDLFDTLPQEYNSITIPILDRDAFRHDVQEIAHRAQDRPEFNRLLAERMKTRREEMVDLWCKAFYAISGHPSLLKPQDMEKVWHDAMHIFHFKSFDTYVRYFAGFMPSKDASSHEQTIHDPGRIASSLAPPAGSDAASSEERAPSSPSTPTSPPSTNPTARPARNQNEQGPRRSSRLKQRVPKEDREDLQPPPARTRGNAGTSGAKRRRDQGDDLQQPAANAPGQPGAKRRRTDTNTVPAATDHTRKRGREEDYDQQSQTADAGAQPTVKKTRTDTNTEQLASSTASGSKGKRKRRPDQADDYELQISQEGGQSGAKRRKAGKDTVPPRRQSTRGGAPTTSRASRAQRQPPSEEDTRPFVADQPDEPDAQRINGKSGGNAPENTARRRSARMRAGTRAGTKPGRSTKSGGIKR